jgi:hypothetical protein
VYLDVHGRPFRLNLRLRHVITTLDVNAHILGAIGTQQTLRPAGDVARASCTIG